VCVCVCVCVSVCLCVCVCVCVCACVCIVCVFCLSVSFSVSVSVSVSAVLGLCFGALSCPTTTAAPQASRSAPLTFGSLSRSPSLHTLCHSLTLTLTLSLSLSHSHTQGCDGSGERGHSHGGHHRQAHVPCNVCFVLSSFLLFLTPVCALLCPTANLP
jgi:hypothetical protein